MTDLLYFTHSTSLEITEKRLDFDVTVSALCPSNLSPVWVWKLDSPNLGVRLLTNDLFPIKTRVLCIRYYLLVTKWVMSLAYFLSFLVKLPVRLTLESLCFNIVLILLQFLLPILVKLLSDFQELLDLI